MCIRKKWKMHTLTKDIAKCGDFVGINDKVGKLCTEDVLRRDRTVGGRCENVRDSVITKGDLFFFIQTNSELVSPMRR